MLAFKRDFATLSGYIFTMTIPDGKENQLTFKSETIGGLTWISKNEIIYSQNYSGSQNFLRLSTKGGEAQQFLLGGRNVNNPTVSRSDKKFAYEQYNENNDVYCINLSKSRVSEPIPMKVLSSTQTEFISDISPDGSKIFFNIIYGYGGVELWISDSDGSNARSLKGFGGGAKWSPNGKKIVVGSRHPNQTNRDIFIINSDGETEKMLTTPKTDDKVPCWSNDGNWVYFTSNRTKQEEIWKISSIGEKAVQITRNGGWSPRASRNGKWIYYSKTRYSGIYKIPSDGGVESLVLDQILFWFDWLSRDGIYFISKNDPSRTIDFYQFQTEDVKTIIDLPEKDCWGLAVSPDERWLYYSQLEYSASDIMIVENFQ